MTQPTPLVTDLPAAAARLVVLAAAALTDPPARRFRCVGIPVHDCEQIAVTIGPMQPGQPGEVRPGQYEQTPNRLRTYQFVVEVARCVPPLKQDGSAPPADKLDASGAQHIGDYQALDGMVKGLGFSGRVHDDALAATGVKAVAPGTTTTVSPSGGFAAVRATLMLTV